MDLHGQPRISQVSLDPGGSGGRQDWCLEGPCHETQGDFPISEPSGGRKASHEPGGSPVYVTVVVGENAGYPKIHKNEKHPTVDDVDGRVFHVVSLAQSRSFNMFKR